MIKKEKRGKDKLSMSECIASRNGGRTMYSCSSVGGRYGWNNDEIDGRMMK